MNCDGYVPKPVIMGSLISLLASYLPHTVKPNLPEDTQTSAQFFSHALSLKQKTKLPNVISRMENDLREEWKTISITGGFVRIEAFAEQVRCVGIEFELSPLTKWGQKLKQ